MEIITFSHDEATAGPIPNLFVVEGHQKKASVVLKSLVAVEKQPFFVVGFRDQATNSRITEPS